VSEKRREWLVALERTREAWQSCYERRPDTKVGRQLELIGAERDEPVIERPCQQCGGEITSSTVKYCSVECRRAAWRVRRRSVAA
jgi:MYND finger